MQGRTTYIQPSQDSMHLAKDTIMIVQACHKLATTMEQPCCKVRNFCMGSVVNNT